MDFALNVQSGPTPAGALLRATQALRELVCGKTTLDHGIAFHCDRFPACTSENQFREVWTPTRADAEIALRSADAFFEEQGTRYARWALAEAQSPEPLDPVLTAAGWERDDLAALVLGDWTATPAADDIRILPARPMRAAYRTLWTQWATYLPAEEREAAVDVVLERLDDHRVDAFVAMVDKQPAAAMALFQVGDIGQVVDVFAGARVDRDRVADATLGHVLALARRLALRIIVAAWPQRDPGGRALFARHGFVESGRLVEYRRAGAPQPEGFSPE
jgi:hypothetical protein